MGHSKRQRRAGFQEHADSLLRKANHSLHSLLSNVVPVNCALSVNEIKAFRSAAGANQHCKVQQWFTAAGDMLPAITMYVETART